MSTLQLQAYDMLKQKLGEAEAKLFLEYIENKVEQNVEHATKLLVTKEDLHAEISNLHKTIYTVGLIQFLAIIGSVIGLISFMLHK